MPDLNFQITGVEAAARGLVPMMQFKLQITSSNPAISIQGLILNAQIQIQSPQRRYRPSEQERLIELFGPPEQWGQTLRGRLWTHAQATVGAFTATTETVLRVPCTFDLNIAATKYFYALEDGEVPLLFLFSGSVFYLSAAGKLQVELISWNKECPYPMPLQRWKELVEAYYPGCAWICLKRDIFDRFYQYRRQNQLLTWEKALEKLLEGQKTGSANAVVRPITEVPV